jgi:hypothetical protein
MRSPPAHSERPIDDVIVRYGIKMVFACAAIALVVVWRVYGARLQEVWGSRGQKVFTASLVTLALASTLAYFEFGWLRFERYMNPHDVYHYYIGAKYSDEHRYFDLYAASLVADDELGRRFTKKSIRNLQVTTKFERVDRVLARTDEIKSRFSDERWREFKTDIDYFRSIVPKWKWQKMLRDKGYNATPVWNSIARVLANAAPTTSVWGMRLLTYIDLALLLAMFFALRWAFGVRGMLFALVFYGTNFMMSHVHIKGAFLRLDWVVCIVIATCAVSRRRYALAGGLMAYAGLARIFPFVFCFGFGVKGMLDWIAWGRARMSGTTRPINKDYLAFFAAFTAVLVALVGMTVLDAGGLAEWRAFLSKIGTHNNDLSTTRVGWRYVALIPWIDFKDKVAAFAQFKGLISLSALAALVPLGFAARRARDADLIPLSFVAVYFLVAPTFYYHVMLIVPLLFLLPRVAESSSHTAGVVMLLVLSLVGYALGIAFRQSGGGFFAALSAVMLPICIYFVALPLRGERLDERIDERIDRLARRFRRTPAADGGAT